MSYTELTIKIPGRFLPSIVSLLGRPGQSEAMTTFLLKMIDACRRATALLQSFKVTNSTFFSCWRYTFYDEEKVSINYIFLL